MSGFPRDLGGLEAWGVSLMRSLERRRRAGCGGRSEVLVRRGGMCEQPLMRGDLERLILEVGHDVQVEHIENHAAETGDEQELSSECPDIDVVDESSGRNCEAGEA
jgi:hypothetical protein